MTPIVMGTVILFSLLVFLMLLRVPIAFCLGIASLATAIYLEIPFFNLFQKMATGITSFTFMCVPFFIIMAQIMTDGGISDRLTKFCNVLVGRMRGGTAIVNCVVSMFFGGISGSSIADVSSIGAFLIPAMVKEGYDPDFSVAVTCTSSVEGVIIPPSQNMIFYIVAAGSGLSISTMFMCGYIPGLILTLALCVCSFVISVKKKYPTSQKHSWRENIVIVREALLGLVTILIVAVGITAGIFTATEAGAIAAVYALLVTTVFYRTMTFKKLVQCLLKSLRTLSTIMAIIATSSAFSLSHHAADDPHDDRPWLLYGYGYSDNSAHAYTVPRGHVDRLQCLSLRTHRCAYSWPGAADPSGGNIPLGRLRNSQYSNRKICQGLLAVLPHISYCNSAHSRIPQHLPYPPQDFGLCSVGGRKKQQQS